MYPYTDSSVCSDKKTKSCCSEYLSGIWRC